MPLIHDIVFADSAQREAALNAADHRQAFSGVPNVGLSIDDVVTLVAAHQRVEPDNPAWQALRRQVYGWFQERYREPDCSVAELSATICEEIADWAELPTTQLAAKTGLAESAVRALIAACVTARDQGLSVLIKSYNDDNAFRQAFERLDQDEREEYEQAFDAWDATKRRTAHQRYKALQRLGKDDPLWLTYEEVEEGLAHTATLLFLNSIRTTVDYLIDNGVAELDEVGEMDKKTKQAIEQFTSKLSEPDQKRVLRAFAIEVMKSILEVVEDGTMNDGPSAPVSWALVEDTEAGLSGHLVGGELHAYLDGDEEYLPKQIED